MTEEEKNILDSCRNIAESILERIKYLFELEISGKKDTEEYRKIIESLKQTRSTEMALYNKFDSSPNSISKIIKEVLNGRYDNPTGDILMVVIDGDLNELIKNRIYQCLFNRMNLNDNPNIKMNPLTDLRISFTSDTINTILKFLNMAILDEKNSSIKNILIKYKYYLAFICPCVCDDLLESNFDIREELYWSMDFYKSLYKLDEKFVKAFTEQNAFGVVEKIANRLVKIPSYQLNQNDVLAKAVMMQIIIRSIVLFLGKEEVNGIRDVMNISAQAARILRNSSQLEDMALESLSTYDSDIELPMRVEMRL